MGRRKERGGLEGGEGGEEGGRTVADPEILKWG